MTPSETGEETDANSHVDFFVKIQLLQRHITFLTH